MRRSLIAGVLLILPLLFTLSCRPQNTQSDLTVAAASDLTNSFEEIGREFQKATGTKVVFNFGSSGILAKQIENGAPVDLFAAANVDYVTQLERKGLIIPDTKKIYARGRLVIWTPRNSIIRIEKLADLSSPDVRRIAIANPEHAPYGMAAKQALEHAGLWEALKTKLVFGENIRQTMQYAQTGNVEVALVSLSLTAENDGQWVLIPAELHNPLDQAFAVIKGTKNEAAARAFAAFVVGPQGQATMKRYGFTLPQ